MSGGCGLPRFAGCRGTFDVLTSRRAPSHRSREQPRQNFDWQRHLRQSPLPTTRVRLRRRLAATMSAAAGTSVSGHKRPRPADLAAVTGGTRGAGSLLDGSAAGGAATGGAGTGSSSGGISETASRLHAYLLKREGGATSVECARALRISAEVRTPAGTCGRRAERAGGSQSSQRPCIVQPSHALRPALLSWCLPACRSCCLRCKSS